MIEIYNPSDNVKKEAFKNALDFDHTELCFKTIFEILNDSGAFVKAFNELLTFDVCDKKQVELFSFGLLNKLLDEENGKGEILIPYNEGVRVTNLERRLKSPFGYMEPELLFL